MAQTIIEDDWSAGLRCRRIAHIPDKMVISEVVRTQTELSRAVGDVEIHQGDENVDCVAWFLDLIVEVYAILVIDLRFGTWQGEEGALMNKDRIISKNLSNNRHPSSLVQVGEEVKSRRIKGIELHVESTTATLSEHVETVGELKEQIPSLDGIHDLVVVFLDNKIAGVHLFLSQTVVSGLSNLGRLPRPQRLLLFLHALNLFCLRTAGIGRSVGEMNINDFAPLNFGTTSVVAGGTLGRSCS
mmetsp:Transcript_11815/g.33705  ORF Transcript_11815/g.33705 Transcript_11815/m.33705 type:complete len:243 (-) Transcript_11815:1195-1923(-)